MPMEPREPSNSVTITTTTIGPEMVEAEAKRFALRTGGLLLMAMAEKNVSEEELAQMLEINKRQLRQQLMGEAWRSYLPLAALCLALGIRMDLRTQSN